MMPYFIFNNILSTNYLTVEKLPPIIKAAKDIQKIEITGRDGFLTNDLGSYKSIIKPVECWVRNLENIDLICSWLSGSANVNFSNEPDRVYKATIINQIDFSIVVREYHRFIIQFECQPHKYSLDSVSTIALTTPQSIFNPGSANSNPIVIVYGTGSIDLVVNGNVINLTNVSGFVIIDSELVDSYKGTLLKNNDMRGEFPELVPGNNIISWTGTVSKVEITPNWRWV